MFDKLTMNEAVTLQAKLGRAHSALYERKVEIYSLIAGAYERTTRARLERTRNQVLGTMTDLRLIDRELQNRAS